MAETVWTEDADLGVVSNGLHAAVRAGDQHLVSGLLHRGACINALATAADGLVNRGDAPIHIAIMTRNVAMMQLLVADGADMNAKNLRG